LPVETAVDTTRLAHQRASTNQQLSRTLLFMPVAEQFRPWDLRTYTGGQLAVLSGREQAYGYRTTERFLSEVAQAGANQSLSARVAHWSYHLWHTKGVPSDTYYVDGHHKAVYSGKLIPRGLVGRLDKVLGCRGLVVLNDAQGHPLASVTSRGDQHLTKGLPVVVQHFEAAVGQAFKVSRLVVDREVMGGEFLASELGEGREIVTILKENQYHRVESFQEVGEFVPWLYDKEGQIIKEVASALFELKVISPVTGQPLTLKVALIRQPKSYGKEAKVIPIVSTSLEAEVTAPSPGEAVGLATAYRKRWPVQENVFKDWLIPLGLDINHGYKKTEVLNSEVVKKREHLAQRITTTAKWAASAREGSKKAGEVSNRRNQQLKELVPKVEWKIQELCNQLEATSPSPTWEQKAECKEAENKLKAPVERLKDLEWKAWSKCNKEYRKAAEYGREHKMLQTQLEKLNATERQMLELDNRKDQVVTAFIVALTNLGMWVRDHFFPGNYANCTWERLLPFLALGGWVSQGARVVKIALKPFNDRVLNRDLERVCELVTAAGLVLPDGRQLHMEIYSDHKAVWKKPELGENRSTAGPDSATSHVPVYSIATKAG